MRNFLHRHRRIAIDTNVFIYHFEAHPSYVSLAREIFAWLERPTHSAVTSTITMTEVLVHHYRNQNHLKVDRYFGLISTFPHLEWIPPDIAIADTAAQLRAQYRLRTPDALQVATAIRSGATAMLSNDPHLSNVSVIEAGILDQLK